MIRSWRELLALVVGVGLAGPAHAITIDFSTEDDLVTPLVNGQAIDSEFGTLFTITSLPGPHLGAAIFDTDSTGPNAGGGDPDLLVDLGNALILQSTDSPGIVGGIFTTPDDEADGGTILFNFLQAVTLQEVALVDINGNGPVFLTLVDGEGDTRSYSVPMDWTFDVTVQPLGWDTLDFTILTPQLGEGGTSATATEDAGFDPNGVVQLAVEFTGSAALDNLRFELPEPSALSLVGLALLGLVFRSR